MFFPFTFFQPDDTLQPFDPTSNAKLQAMYSALAPGAAPSTTWDDLSTHARHATRVGAVTYDAANAVAGGYPAYVWPASPVADQGFLLPAMTIKELIIVSAFGDGTTTSYGGTNALIISGVSGASGNPLTLYNQSNNQIFSTMGTTRYSPETPVNGLPKVNSTILPLPFQVQNFTFSSAFAETNWKLGYRDDSAPTQSFRGVMTMVFAFNDLLTAEEKYQYYSYINDTLGKNIPIPSWVFTPTSDIIPPDTGPLRPGVPYYPCLQDMSAVPNFPFDWAIFASTDHSELSGIYMWMGNGDPAVPSVLKSYDEALADGDFDYLASKPAANPVYQDLVQGSSTETPHTQVIDGQVVLMYQQAGVGNNQSTLLALSSDGINYTRQGVVVDYTPGTAVGDGHTGYFHWAPNPFPDAINPATGLPWPYIGYSLHGGTIKFFMAQWGSENPKSTTPWTCTAILMPVRGRTTAGYSVPTYGSIGVAFNSLDLSTVTYDPIHEGYRTLMTLTPQVAGGGGRINETYEVLLDSTGTQVLGLPQKVFARGTTGTYNEYQVTDFDTLPYGATKACIYQAVASGDLNSVAAATTTPRAVDITRFAPITPVIPSVTTLEADFTVLTALPAWLSAVAVGTTAPLPVFSALGLSVTGTSSGAVPGEYYLFADPSMIPNNVSFIEVEVEGWATPSTNKQRVPFLGLSASKAVYSGISNAVYMSNNLTTGVDLVKRQKIAGVETSPTNSTYYYSIGYSNNSSTAPKRLGLRWFTSSALYLLGESGQEFETFTLSGSVDRTIGYYPFWGVQFKNTNVTERITKFRVRYG